MAFATSAIIAQTQGIAASRQAWRQHHQRVDEHLLRPHQRFHDFAPAGVDPNTNEEYRWRPLGEQFAIRGSRPVDQYNFLRLIHPERREYEFRFVPKNGADVANFTEDSEVFWLRRRTSCDFEFQGQSCSAPARRTTARLSVRPPAAVSLRVRLSLPQRWRLELRPIRKRSASSMRRKIFIAEFLPDIDGIDAQATDVVNSGLVSNSSG